MEEMAELLFVLSSNDRQRLLLELKTDRPRLTQLAQKLSATVQETSKHLARLSDAKLIEKYSNGSYRLTAYGKQVLRLLPSFDFLSKNREYFLSHDLSFLPPGFTQRIGELSDYQYRAHISGMISHAEQVVREAEQYAWLMVDQCPTYSFEPKHPEKVSVRALVSSIRPEAYQWGRTTFGDRLELRFQDDVKISISMNEKIAGVCFPDLDGRIDFNGGFISNSPDFHRWCHDLYSIYWDRSKMSPPPELRNSIAQGLKTATHT